ncbi:hypothetical protein AGLY_017183 [Aphis glycines]|uniref:Uncharacterized protein n=1 Tax=Aphis glycines TaxID=307491 RepID=A0A6G0SWU2_APHGL|nr:hypothetical protein AGLY_017183 [Aphis glycines]
MIKVVDFTDLILVSIIRSGHGLTAWPVVLPMVNCTKTHLHVLLPKFDKIMLLRPEECCRLEFNMELGRRGVQTFSSQGSFESSQNIDDSQIKNNKKINVCMNRMIIVDNSTFPNRLSILNFSGVVILLFPTDFRTVALPYLVVVSISVVEEGLTQTAKSSDELIIPTRNSRRVSSDI